MKQTNGCQMTRTQAFAAYLCKLGRWTQKHMLTGFVEIQFIYSKTPHVVCISGLLFLPPVRIAHRQGWPQGFYGVMQ